MFGALLGSTGCNCCSTGAWYDPCYGPYNPYAGICVNEDIWMTPGVGRSQCHCGHAHSGYAAPAYDFGYPTSDCGCHAPVSDCGCGAPVTGDCGCGAPVTSDCGCASGYPIYGDSQIMYGEPTYVDPQPAPPAADEYYLPPNPDDDFEPDDEAEASYHDSTLPRTLVVPARL